MIVLTIVRKPIDGTISGNVLKWMTGGLNIDGCRIGQDAGWDYPNGRGGQGWHGVRGLSKNCATPMKSTLGRWPSNLSLQHLENCKCVGEKRIKGNFLNGVCGAVGYGFGMKARHAVGHTDPDGTETVLVWDCFPGCPVAELDRQSGNSKSAVGTCAFTRAATSGWQDQKGAFTPGRQWEAEGYADTGGASRFFKQVKR
jgi:hypothetical protein